MKNSSIEAKNDFWQLFGAWFTLSLSDKVKFSIKVSISIALAYLIPLSQGWTQPQTAVITIIIIASASSVVESITKGMNRVIGTIIGAIIGMILISIFPQDRELYLLLLSLFVITTLYLARSFKGDMTIFLISAVTMMMVFKNGEVDGVFAYGVDRTYMTIIGIVIYTFVGIFLWPVKAKDDVIGYISTLLDMQSDLYQQRDAKKEDRQIVYKKLIGHEQLFAEIVVNSNDMSEEICLNKKQWNTLIRSSKSINETLTLLSQHDKEHFADNYAKYIDNYHSADEEILKLFEAITLAWTKDKEITIPKEWKPRCQIERLKELSHIDRASLTSTILEMKKLHKKLRELAEKLNAMTSYLPTTFALDNRAVNSSFLWFDIEDMKGTLVSFLVFWFATLIWIFVNPPAGFLLVTLSTILSLQTTYSPVKPSILIIVFSFSFVFATLMYVSVLPNLYYSWELGLFLFVYSFIGFHLINPKLSLFFLLGIIILGIDNTMNYNFNTFLMTLFVFYFFLFILLLFYYIPFSTKPEHLFLTMKQRFFKLSWNLLQKNNNIACHKEAFGDGLAAKYSEIHLMSTVKKMQLWGKQIDMNYFDTVDQEVLFKFTKECESFAYLLQMMYYRDIQIADNRLIKAFAEERKEISLLAHLGKYASGAEVTQIAAIWRDEKQLIEVAEGRLEKFLENIKFSDYQENEILEFYENISLHKNVWISLFNCQKLMGKIDFTDLQTNRF